MAWGSRSRAAGSRGAGGMRSVVWRRAVTRFVMPELPGSWNVARSFLYREPVDWLLCWVGMSNSRWSSNYSVHASVQVMAVPKEYLGSSLIFLLLGHGSPQRSWWEAATNLAEAEPAMGQIRALIQAEALPIFDQLGTVSGYATTVAERAQENPLNYLHNEELFYLRLIQGDVSGALRAAEAAEHGARADGIEFALKVCARVARTAEAARRDPAEALGILHGNADYTRAQLGLPPRPGKGT